MTAIPVEEQFIGAGQVYLDGVFFGNTRENNVWRLLQQVSAPYINGAGGILARTDYHDRRPMAELELTVVELSPEALALIVPGASVQDVGDNTVIGPPASRRLQAADYHDWELRVPGLSNREVRFRILDGIATSNPEFTAADDGTAPLGPRITIQSRINPDNIEAADWTITRTPASYS